MGHRAREAVETTDDQHVALPDIVKGLSEPLACGYIDRGYLLLEDLLTACFAELVELDFQPILLVERRGSSITDQQMPTPVSNAPKVLRGAPSQKSIDISARHPHARTSVSHRGKAVWDLVAKGSLCKWTRPSAGLVQMPPLSASHRF